MSNRYIMYGWHLSYFSGKTRAYLHYKRIDFVERAVNAYTLMRTIPRKTGATVMPVVVTPKGEWLQDSTHIMEVLEACYPESPVLPTTPRQRIAAQLLEAWADEWWIPIAMHYRWSFADNYPLFECEAGRALLPGCPAVLQRRIAAFAAAKMRGYLPAMGVVPEQYALLEDWTRCLLDALEEHFTVLPFLFGTCPSVADFALLGPMYGHLSRDPWPREHLLVPRPQLMAWVERMNTVQVGAGQFAADDHLPATLQPLFDSLFREFAPMVVGIHQALQAYLPQIPASRSHLPRALAEIELPMAGGNFRRAATPFTLWKMQRIEDSYQELTPAARVGVDAWLDSQQAGAWLRTPSQPRLARAGLHLRLV